MKRKLLLAALCVVGAVCMRAQTDVTSLYVTNSDFESTTYTTPYHPNNDRDITQPDGWILTYTDGVSYDSSILTASQATYSNISNQGLTIPGDGRGNQTYAVRYHNNGNKQLITLAQQAQVLPEGYYTVSGLFWTQNQNEMVVGFYLGTYGTDTSKKYTGGNASWKTLSYDFESDGTSETTIGIFFQHASSNQMVGGVDNITLTYTPYVRPTAISLNETSLSLNPTGTSTLTIAYTPENVNKDASITWKSSDESVVTVDGNGVVTAVGVGTAMITATTANNISTTCQVTVTDVVAAAAPSSWSDIAEGDFYIVNAATGKFLGGANTWGTQASLINHGIPFTATLISDGVYTLNSHTQEKVNTNKCYLDGTYIDANSKNLYITSLGSGKYSISTAEGTEYLTANVSNTVVANTASTANSVLAQWYFVSKDNLESALSNATSANPVDATFYIADPNFSRNHLASAYSNNTRTLTACETYPWTITATNYNLKGGNAGASGNGNYCAESYHATFTLSQTLEVPNGMYKLRAQAVENASPVAVVYANEEMVAFKQMANGENSMTTCSDQFTAGNYYTDWVTVNVTEGTLTIGVKSTSNANWCVWDNFELYYCGATIGGEAKALPETAMEKDKWYYFDINTNGMYNLTTTTLGDIIYTKDGATLIENQNSVTATFSKAENEQLTAGRYYVKSASDQILEVTTGAYVYNVGAPTLSVTNGGYTQSPIFTVTFTEASTSDPEGSITFNSSSTATINGETANLTAVENGFSLDLGTLTESADYAISIPAEVYGYSGESMNEAISLTVHTPAIFDGFFYLRNTDTANTEAAPYLSRGGTWATQAIMDTYGLATKIVTDSENKTKIQYFDNLLYLSDGGFCYGDAYPGGSWVVSKVDGGYKFLNAEKSDGSYLAVWEGIAVGDGREGDNLVGTTNVWVLETPAEHEARYTVNANTQVAAATAKIDALSSITTKEALDSELAANYNATSIAITGVKGEKYQEYAEQKETLSENTYYSETVENLKPGLYKLSVDAFQRAAWYDWVRDAGGARGVIYLYANAAKTQLKSVMEASSATAYTDDYANGDKHYPNNLTSAYTALENSDYSNDVYVYVEADEGQETGTLEIGIKNPNRLGNGVVQGTWAVYNNWTLTYYDQTEATMAITDVQYATFVAPFDVTIPADVKAYTVTAVDVENVLTMSEVETTIPANTPVVLYTESSDGYSETFYGKSDAVDTPTAGLLTGVYEATEATAGTYVLIKSGDHAAFGEVKTGDEPTIPANRAYLTVPDNANPAKVFYFSADDIDTEATAIGGIEALTSGNVEGIYTLGGMKVNQLQKGINIVKTKDGKTLKIQVK